VGVLHVHVCHPGMKMNRLRYIVYPYSTLDK
jgi:hypothetical protein